MCGTICIVDRLSLPNWTLSFLSTTTVYPGSLVSCFCYLNIYVFLSIFLHSPCLSFISITIHCHLPKFSSKYTSDSLKCERYLCLTLCVCVCVYEWVSVCVYIYIYICQCLVSPMAWEIWVQSQVELYQRLKKWYLMPPCLTLSIIRYSLRVQWGNHGKGVAPSSTPWCSSYWKGSLQVTFDYGHQLYFTYIFAHTHIYVYAHTHTHTHIYIYIYIYIYMCVCVCVHMQK